MTNNQQLAAITAEEREALIADCKSDIDFFTWEINKFAAKKLPPSVMARMQSQLKRQQIALARLEAKSIGTLINTFLADDPLAISEAKKRGMKIIVVYDAPPVPVMQPVVLPSAWWVRSGKEQILAYPKEIVHEAIRAAGGSVKE